MMSSSRMRKEFQAKVTARAEARAGGEGPGLVAEVGTGQGRGTRSHPSNASEREPLDGP